ncbi:phospholipase D [Purpureocillium lilacinum]|uniref:Phospholipase D n=1 Tax=Purpureocillium lilacinum TaxID=33203 RepID=A0A179F3S5_PURLI|nr:phospholipase D [Purpureocillium lilacinum]
MSYGVRDALEHGANALEIDVTAWKQGWWADHDGTLTSYGDAVETIFRTIANERRLGKNVIFVWLDIKNPDEFDASNRQASIEALQSLAREHLEQAGVRVLYGFSGESAVRGRAYGVIRQGLNDYEAIAVDGDSNFASKSFEALGPANIAQRVMSKGLFNPTLNFGDCASQTSGICPQLRIAAGSGSFGKVFGWTIAKYNMNQAAQLMSDAHADGLIYGFVATHYYDHADTRKAFRILQDWLDKNGEKRHLATISDKPW